MGKGTEVADRALLSFVSNAPGWLVVGVALILFPGVALVVPEALSMQRAMLIELNCVGAVLAAVVFVGWLVVRIELQDRRHLVEWTTNLRLLDSQEFEWLVGELFRREGWHIEETGRRDGPDGNIDLELKRNGARRIVQCKRWASWSVDVNEVRAFLGTLMRESLPARAGIFVTLSRFTDQAREEAAQAGLPLIDGRDLYRMIESHRTGEPCPICKRPMLFDRSTRGWWFRCTASGCSGKRDLGGDPERAVELLIQQPVQ